jgi:nucleoside-diphosphate-sugar epimerase
LKTDAKVAYHPNAWCGRLAYATADYRRSRFHWIEPGSDVCRSLGWRVITFDNLRRRGSELALARLQGRGITFIHGDVRNPEDLGQLPAVDLLVERSAEPSVHAGYEGDVRYLVNTNLLGTFNCLEYSRRHGTAVIFLSTSRVYSIPASPIMIMSAAPLAGSQPGQSR